MLYLSRISIATVFFIFFVFVVAVVVVVVKQKCIILRRRFVYLTLWY